MYAFQLVYKASPYISKVMTTLNIAFSVIASSYLSTSLENLLKWHKLPYDTKYNILCGFNTTKYHACGNQSVQILRRFVMLT